MRDEKLAVQVTGLTKSYQGKTVLSGLDLSVKRGTVFGLLGANGAGKSTTIECILGTRRADSGAVSVLGHDPRKERGALFQRVGVQFQEGDYQPEIKVFELCEEIACLYNRPADWRELCRRFGIGDKLKNAGGLTILLTSHFMDEVEALCDEICILRRGTAVFYGTVDQARTQSGCEKFEDAYLQLSGEEDAA